MKHQRNYTTEDGSVQYGFKSRGRTWAFNVVPAASKDKISYTFFHKLTGRAETAHRVANLISGAFKRHGALDGSTKSNINRLLSTAAAKVEAVE